MLTPLPVTSTIHPRKLGDFESTVGSEALIEDETRDIGVTFIYRKGGVERKFLVPWGQVQFVEEPSAETDKLHAKIREHHGAQGVRVIQAAPAVMISNKQEWGKPVPESLTGDDQTPVVPVQVSASLDPAVAASRAALAAVSSGAAELTETGEVVPVEAEEESPVKAAKRKAAGRK